ncbi:Cupredoxin superfamily protein isoform 1 [Hibiscus syriacus]|uniref:Cupredoxin superfamily protein isoform 1 n=1 Tax=Hibiscus syriacus TaxID=106335 RepID=A0A6A3A6U5_HIBSY|nr:uncharacterized protein LOC120132404 [Hibiscus syriacus]KAE8700090.1 Cupredoxin superfamily protein isoform 1 [Hibiscus syriacus]
MALSISKQKIMEQKLSLQKENQISVDPISLRESISSSMGETSFNMMLPPVEAPQPDSAVPHPLIQPPPLPPMKHKFLTSPVSTSSPRFRSILSRKNLKIASQDSPRQVDHESVHDLWHHDGAGLISDHDVKDDDGFRKSIDFKCGALCMFLPGFGKGKAVRPRMRETIGMENDVISTRVSLEKFEYGSWGSSTFIPDNDDDNGESAMNLFFDLPSELIKNLGDDTDLPVCSAFVFDNKDMKGILKKGSTPTATTGRKYYELHRHLRFSTVRNSDESLFSRA